MKKVIALITLICTAMPTVLMAKDEASIYVQTISSSMGHHSESSGIEKGHPLSKISHLVLDKIQAHIKQRVETIKIASSKATADYQVVFWSDKINSRKNKKFNELKLDASVNKHRKTADVIYKFRSPWMRGELYLKNKQIVGGFAVVSMSKAAIYDELYNIANNDWQKLKS